MSLSIESIPGAKDYLKEIAALAKDPEREIAFTRFFVAWNGHVPGDEESGPVQKLYLCNLVFQGGGVLGLAHVGFLAGLEEAGIRCAGLAGTSAGSIVATAIACRRQSNLEYAVAPELLGLIARMPMSKFIDGPAAIRVLIKRALNRRPVVGPSFWPSIVMAVTRLFARRGLNSGRAFEAWLRDAFDDWNVHDNQSLDHHLLRIEQKLTALGAGLRPQYEYTNGRFAQLLVPPREYLLKVIATALPAGLKLTFPHDLQFLRPDYMQASPAIFVRGSMAIPGFFEPQFFEVQTARWRGEVTKRLTGLMAQDTITDLAAIRELQVLDGGLLSNVPIDAFEAMTRPSAAWSAVPSSQSPAMAPTASERLSPSERARRQCRENGKFVRCPPVAATHSTTPDTVVESGPRQPDLSQGSYERFPTIVATLVERTEGVSYRTRRTPRGFAADVLRIAQAVQVQRDRDAWRRVLSEGNASIRIVEVDTSGFNWLNFTMTTEEMGSLFLVGLKRAYEFLRTIEPGSGTNVVETGGRHNGPTEGTTDHHLVEVSRGV